MSERTIWITAGLLGLAVAVALALLTSRVSQPPVGVPGEPVSAGQQLAPARTSATGTARARRPARTTPASAPPAAQPPIDSEDDDAAEADSSGSGDDDGSGRGRGRGRGRGGDD